MKHRASSTHGMDAPTNTTDTDKQTNKQTQKQTNKQTDVSLCKIVSLCPR